MPSARFTARDDTKQAVSSASEALSSRVRAAFKVESYEFEEESGGIEMNRASSR